MDDPATGLSQRMGQLLANLHSTLIRVSRRQHEHEATTFPSPSPALYSSPILSPIIHLSTSVGLFQTLAATGHSESSAVSPKADSAYSPRNLAFRTSDGATTNQGASRHSLSRHIRQKRPTSNLLQLPIELQLQLLDVLPYADTIRLRQTCRFYYGLATPTVVRSIIGPDRFLTGQLSHCRDCLRHDASRIGLLLCARAADEARANTAQSNSSTDAHKLTAGSPSAPRADAAAAPPVSAPASLSLAPLARCISCALSAEDTRIRIGRRVELASLDHVWVCRWCGWPVGEGAAFGHAQFHRACHRRYGDVLCRFFALGWAQFALGVSAAVMAWRYWKGVGLVVAPTVAGFLLLWVCLIILLFRSCHSRTYHLSLAAELVLTISWIPPIIFVTNVIGHASAAGLPIAIYSVASLTLFSLNFVFRFLNVLGNLALLCKYDVARHHRPVVPWWRRWLLNPVMTFLIFWTYPTVVEQKREY